MDTAYSLCRLFAVVPFGIIMVPRKEVISKDRLAINFFLISPKSIFKSTLCSEHFARIKPIVFEGALCCQKVLFPFYL